MSRPSIGDTPMTGAERQARCHVRFQGVRTQKSARFFSSRLISLMQACAVGAGTERRLIML